MTGSTGVRPRLRGQPRPTGQESRSTAALALAAHAGVAMAKAVAALLTGSAAMVAETLHSLADVVNELLLLVGVRRSRRPDNRHHPRGYGRDRYFWSLLAAVGIFLAGGVLGGHELTGPPWWDAGAGIGVGLLLMWVASRLVLLNRRLLLSPSVPPAVVDHVASVARAEPWVLEVTDAVVVYAGPGSLSVALDVAPDVSLDAEELVVRLGALRRHLVDHAGVTSVAITLVPSPTSTAAPAVAAPRRGVRAFQPSSQGYSTTLTKEVP